MSSKKVTEKRSRYATEPRARKSARKSSGRVLKESRPAYRSTSIKLEDINRNLQQLQAGLSEIQQRLTMFEAQLSILSEAQKQSAALSTTAVDDLGWLKLSESSFTFWDNAEDEIYDTL